MPINALRQWLFSISMALLIGATAGTSSADAAGSGPGGPGGLERCRTLADDAARLRCFEDTTSPPAKTPATPGGWRLLHTPRQGGGETVSMIHTADPMRSDPDLAGLMLRCSDNGVEILVVLISPFPPRSRPAVTVPSTNDEIRLPAMVVPPGAALRLPDDALALANGPWQALAELPIKVEDAGTSIRGIIPLGGLDAALKALRARCPTP